MLKFAPYVLKNLWRRRGRALLTVGGTAAAIFVFCLVESAQRGLRRLTEDQRAARTLVVFQQARFCPATSKLPEDHGRRVAELPEAGVVTPVLVFTNNCRASLDAVVFQGLPPDQLRAARELTLVAGDWSAFDARADAAVVGRALAARRRLRVGERFALGGVSVHVAAMAAASTPADENHVYTRLDFLQRSRGRAALGVVTQFEVTPRADADPERLAAAIDALFQSAAVATTTRPKGVFQRDTLADLVDLIALTRWLGAACLGLVLAVVAAASVMTTQDRAPEYALLQTLGLRPGGVLRLVLAESALQSGLGGAAGAAAALAWLTWGGVALGAEGVILAFEPSVDVALWGLAAAVAAGLLAAVAPGWQASRAPLARTLRRVD